MTPEKQRIAIAEACGWVFHIGGVYPPMRSPLNDGRIFREPPDYLSDLNAMHEAEKVLTDKQYDHYIRQELVIASVNATKSGRRHSSCATAAQRAEAFLRTLNLWED